MGSEKLHDNKSKRTVIKRIEETFQKYYIEKKDGKTLFGLIKGVMAHNLDYDEIRNDVEKEIIQEFSCCISETIDVWDLYEENSFIDLHLILDEKLKKLNNNRIMVFGETEMMSLTGETHQRILLGRLLISKLCIQTILK
jgi:hypothetical protein